MKENTFHPEKSAKVDLKAMFPEELEKLIADLSKERYRARQLFSWIHKHGVSSFDEMTNLSLSFRQELGRFARIGSIEEENRIVSSYGNATKFLFRLEDGKNIESVLIDEDDRQTVCISSQIGCILNCRFCATGSMGYLRNLKATEIIDQLIYIRKILQLKGKNVTNVVFMGMGEPLLNYDNVVRSVRLMQSELGISLGAKRITISTVGIIPGIERLAQEKLKIGLAISLNATTDNLRNRLMPINKKYPISKLLMVTRQYAHETDRWVTFEYVLIKDVNDSDADAYRLYQLVRDIPCKINLISFNPVPQSSFQRPEADRIREFQEYLCSHHLTATLRESAGPDIAAACGQLCIENTV